MGIEMAPNLIVILLFGVFFVSQAQHAREGFFNTTSFANLFTPLTFNKHIGISFRTCYGGNLFSQVQRASRNSMSLDVRSDGLLFTVMISARRYETRINANLLDNQWHNVNILNRMGNLTISTSGHQQVIANSTYDNEILSHMEYTSEKDVLVVGRGFNGCILEGPSIVFNTSQIQDQNVKWGPCPLPNGPCVVVNHCANDPCMTHGRCVPLPDRYLCLCTPRYAGINCQIDNGPPCSRHPCKNNGTCSEDKSGDYICYCASGYAGKDCDTKVSINICDNNGPCLNNGTCVSTIGSNSVYRCDCPRGFEGKDCEIDVDDCLSAPCLNGGICKDGVDSFTCNCDRTGYQGFICDININECENNPCLNNGICFDNYGAYTCQCAPGFSGQNCELKLSECASNPCPYPNSVCIETGQSYQCVCKPGYSGMPNCQVDFCLSMPCKNGGSCISTVNGFSCACHPGFTGSYCEFGVDWCGPCVNSGVYMQTDEGYFCRCQSGFTGKDCSIPISCSAAPCQRATACYDFPGGYYCACEIGWSGQKCDQPISCEPNTCFNGGTCIDTINTSICLCKPGYEGPYCESNVDDCMSMPCKHGGTCFDGVDGYLCNCTSEYMGTNCELEYNVCARRPCLNNGTCILKEGKKDEYYCECEKGFEGLDCENDVDDCVNKKCPPNRVCFDGVNSYECLCQEGYGGPNCSINVANCNTKPCKHGATCIDTTGNYTCVCPPGFTGHHCEQDIDECVIGPRLCNNGICVNNLGSYQCFCTPGFSGDHCEIDFDECLSRPCYNGATCENKINGFNCICPPGYSGLDCSQDIDECESNPCANGSTCHNEIATFTCDCAPGFTGRLCDLDIDDCESSPCLNGVCVNGRNEFHCNCTNTGFEGAFCEINIDECASNPCQHGAPCEDLVNGFKCACYPGYTGEFCEMDINECESNPCHYGGTCKEKSKPEYYYPSNVTMSPFSSTPFDYSQADGYVCLCVQGTMGVNCEIDIKECDSNPCHRGQCIDGTNGYKCECDLGFEGVHCEDEINECDRYSPCGRGTCIDRVAGYDCLCEPNYGGENCTVELTGCSQNECLNNGTCIPYLEKETFHKFNCSCPNGFHGPICEKVTTMSFNGSSYVMVSTQRDEGYDIQFRFKTTLSDGLLAIGKGSTYYILKLVNGRLNLHSSILNKWEGVFIGSSLNDSNWQKVFVAINSSHLVLAANEEQTIYPINLNEGANTTHTSFPTTYLGGSISYLRILANGPKSFVGCIQDATINGHYILPQDTGVLPVSFVQVEVGCQRNAQCQPNPCHSGGHCTDLWMYFSCTCERPYLGKTCQSNFTAATFGYENITDSVVTVTVDQMARKAVRNIMDISMFIRTREPNGGIFSLGSKPNSVNYSEETVIGAKLANGELKASFQFNGMLEFYGVDGVRLDNGYFHLIQVVRNATLVQVKINGTEYFRKTISATGHLDLQVLTLGAGPKNDSSYVRDFKGVIQDVQMSNGSRTMIVEFYPLDHVDVEIPPSLGAVTFNESLVLSGIVSDDSCRSQPCMHGGTCTVTWNDFSCACVVGHKGKLCQEMEFCQVQDCPAGSACRNLNHGYECVANITMHSPLLKAPTLRYMLVHGEQSVSFDDVSVAYRSRIGGTLLRVGPTTEGTFFAVAVFNEIVFVVWNLSGDEVIARNVTKDSRDGDWTTIWLKLDESLISGGISGALEESSQYFSANFSKSLFTQLVSTANISIGGHDPGLEVEKTAYTTVDAYQTNTVDLLHGDGKNWSADILGTVYRGCIGEVRIGGLLLPYFSPDELNNTNASTRDHFELVTGSSAEEQLGCLLCFDTECMNGGKCSNASASYSCSCNPGYDGDNCDINIDECVENDCKNNSTCIDGIANYQCECLPGWTGSLCDIDIDECASNPCLNNGTCKDLLARFECTCPPEFVGLRCESVKQVTCENAPCHHHAECLDIVNTNTSDNFTCVCTEGFVGTYCAQSFCEETPCLRGVCLSNRDKPICDCPAGFTGKLCDLDINECESNPCEHGGKCFDEPASFSCDCTGTGFSGDTCNMDIDECKNASVNCNNGQCINEIGTYHCACNEMICGAECTFNDPCYPISPCENNGRCLAQCIDKPDYVCSCPDSFTGKNCTEVPEFSSSRVVDIALIVVPILAILLLGGLVSLSLFLMMARKKRATRGTYSPSSQEYTNPRVELDNVIKPPPEERLI